MAFNVYVTRRIPEPGLELLRNACRTVDVNPHDRPLTAEEFLAAAHGRDGLLTMLNDGITETFLAANPQLRAISQYAVGFNNIDLPACTRRKIAVTNTPGVLTNATAETAWALLFACARRVVESDQFLRAGKWNGWGPMQFLGVDIVGKTLGIIGAGRIGEKFALMSRGFDMKILYHSRRVNEMLERELAARKMRLNELLQQSDFIAIHAPLTAETRHLIGVPQFALMKPSAILINTARGPIIDEAALLAALRTNRIRAAGLDVYEFEPAITAGLTGLSNIVLLPHIGSATVETREKMAIITAEALIAMLHGQKPVHPLNPELWPAI